MSSFGSKGAYLFSRVVSSPNHKHWINTIKNEMDLMSRNNVYELVNLSTQRKSIRNKCIFKIKLSMNGSIDKFKVHLMVKGFTQIEGMNFKETFAPMVRFFSNNLCLFGLKMVLNVVKITFLDGSLE